MSKPQFTPGPHSVVQADHLGAHAYAVQAADGDFLAVGCLWSDACLFAAAPSLHSALKALLLQALQSPLNDPANEWGYEAIQEATAALKKAEGES